MRIFVAGATGAVGQHLVPGLVATGHDITATTRSEDKAARLRAQGATPVGLVLRYGSFYGPGASAMMLDMVRKHRFPVVGSGAGVWSFTEITDAAAAAAAALTQGAPGVYNVVDDDPAPVSAWLPYLGAKAPAHLPVWLGRLAVGEMVVAQMTNVRGSSNEKAKRDLDWLPKYPSWRDGFPVWVRA
jgi:nucleoside-diphosphate-sugar epimerase